MKRFSMALLGCTALGFSLALQGPIPSPAQAQAQVQASAELDPKNPTVQSLQRVRYGDAPSKFVLIRAVSGIWEESQEDVPNKWQPSRLQDVYVTSYIQTGEDATSIELYDLNRDVKMTIDLAAGTVSSTGAGATEAVVRKITDRRGLSMGPGYSAAPKFDVANWVRSPVVGSASGDKFTIPIRADLTDFIVYAGDRVNTVMVKQAKTPTLKTDTAGAYGGNKGEFNVKLKPGERITRLTGTYDDEGGIRSLQISTTLIQSPVFGTPNGQRQFNLAVPKGHVLTAITGRHDARTGGSVLALGIATVPIMASAPKTAAAEGDIPFAGAEPELPVVKFEGVWVRDPFHLQRAPAANTGIKPKSNPSHILNGTWLTQEHYVIRRDENDATGMTAELRVASSPREVGVYVSKDGEHFQAKTPLAGIPFFTWSPEEKGGAPRLRFGNGQFMKKPPLPNQELKRTVAVEKVSQEDSWLVDKIPLGLYFNFAGYDITQINPFVLAEHFKAPVFAPGTSTGYEFLDRKIVPHGLQYRQEVMDETFFSESAITTEKELQESSSFSIGLNVAARGKGEPPSDKPKGAGGINYAKSQMTGTSDNKNTMRSFGIKQIHDYVLILDQGHMKLSTGFLNMIADIKANRRPVSDLFEKFGTHYPNAVTYGASARASMRFDSSDVRSWAENRESVSASVTIPVKAMEVTPSISSEKETKESNRMSASNKVETFTAVGGNAAGSMASFQADATRVVPVLFDLRPIHELINPIHFDDEEVLGRVRTEIVKEWDARFAGISLNDDKSREPKVYEYSSEGLRCDVTDAETMEMFGSIKLTFQDDQGPKIIDVLNGSSQTNPRKFDCAKGQVAPGTEFKLITVAKPSADVVPGVAVATLMEADLGNFIDKDDPYEFQKVQFEGADENGAYVYRFFFSPKNPHPRFRRNGKIGAEYDYSESYKNKYKSIGTYRVDPTMIPLSLRVTVREIKLP